MKREWWESFFQYFPETVNPHAYKNQLAGLGIQFEEPGARFIYDPNYKSSPAERCKWILPDGGSGLEPILAGFSLPEILAVSGNCVTNDFNRHPAHPRLYSMRDASLQVLGHQYYPPNPLLKSLPSKLIVLIELIRFKLLYFNI